MYLEHFTEKCVFLKLVQVATLIVNCVAYFDGRQFICEIYSLPNHKYTDIMDHDELWKVNENFYVMLSLKLTKKVFC